MSTPYPTLADKTIVERKGEDALDRGMSDVLDVREKKAAPPDQPWPDEDLKKTFDRIE